MHAIVVHLPVCSTLLFYQSALADDEGTCDVGVSKRCKCMRICYDSDAFLANGDMTVTV